MDNGNLTHILNWTIRKTIDDRTTLHQVRHVDEYESEIGHVTVMWKRTCGEWMNGIKRQEVYIHYLDQSELIIDN